MDQGEPPAKTGHTIQFWGIFVALCILSFISALDVAIITTALPTITAEIGGANIYVWIANSFVLASSVLQPLCGQLANIYGRRIPFIGSIVLFTLGSGIAGGATSAGMLIAGRTIQGIGAGGIYVLIDIVCCDLVPLRERGKYLSLMFSWSGMAAALGPVVGGALAEANWRWIFYLNIPICALTLVILLLFMRVKTTNLADSGLGQIDFLGNLIFIPSMISLLLGLVTGGIEHPWSSWRIVLPLVLGIAGWICFHIQQSFSSHPSVPPHLFSNRTSAAAYLLTFLSSVLVQAISYFLPVYFQAVHGTTTLRSGIDFLPFAISTLGSAVISGILLSKFGAYRPIHAVSFALSAIGFGLLTLLNSRTKTVAWVFFQLIAGAGSGTILSALLPAIMAALAEADVASSSATFSFVRTFGYIWGVTIASIIFNGQFNKHLPSISSQTLRDQLRNSAAYSFASQAHRLRTSIPEPVWNEVVEVYVKSLRAIWWVGLGFSIVSLFVVALEKDLKLREDLKTDYGIKDEKNGGTPADEESGLETN
ncbi:MFS transporter [Trichophyton mentagrophytes]|nr:MFS transporter [Trichophyton mentagrophytes]